MAKFLTFIFFFIGVILCALLAWYTGFDSVLTSMECIGLSGLAILCVAHLVTNLALAISCHQAFKEVPLKHFFKVRLLRDSAATCLPFSQLGGMAIAIKTTHSKKLHIDWVKAIGINIFDLTTEVVAQVGFLIIALGCLLLTAEHTEYFKPVCFGVVALFFGVLAFIWTQKKGGKIISIFASFLSERFAKDWTQAFDLHGNQLSDYLSSLWRQGNKVSRNIFGHFICWNLSAVVTWLTLYLLHSTISIPNAIALEGLVCATLSAGFFVPAALGIQEGAYIGIGHIFHIPADIAMSLSLLRRARDLVVGVPALLLWQGDSVRRFLKKF